VRLPRLFRNQLMACNSAAGASDGSAASVAYPPFAGLSPAMAALQGFPRRRFRPAISEPSHQQIMSDCTGCAPALPVIFDF
jgi:hypothetical protein